MLYLAAGRNEFLREEFVEQLKTLMRKLPLGEHNIDELPPGSTVADIIAASSVTPFLSAKRMVIARGVLAGGRGPSRARSRVRRAAPTPPTGPIAAPAAYVPNPPEPTPLVLG